jgi:hypothetical protein
VFNAAAVSTDEGEGLKLGSLSNLLCEVENHSEEETDDAMLLPLSDTELIDLTLSNSSCEIDLDLN